MEQSSQETLTKPLLAPPRPSPTAPSPTPLDLTFPSTHPLQENNGTSPECSGELPLPPASSAITPYHSCSYLSAVLFSWLHPILRAGYSKALELRDIPRLSPEDSASAMFGAFVDAWSAEKKKKKKKKKKSNNDDKASHVGANASSTRIRANVGVVSGNGRPFAPEAAAKHLQHEPSLARVLSTCFFPLALRTGFYALLRTLSMAFGPLFLLCFCDYTSNVVTSTSEGSNVNRLDGYLLVLGLFIAKVVESVSQRHWYFHCQRLGMQMRSVVLAAVFEKELRLSSIGRETHSSGEIVNYVAVDAYRVGEFPWHMHYIWSVPLQLALALIILFVTIGLATIPGLAIIFCTVGLNIPLARSMQHCQSQYMVAQDQRLKATTELLNNVKVLKLQAWEDKFRLRMEGLREEEFKWLSKLQTRRSLGTVLYWFSPIVVGSVVFATCIWLNQRLDATVVFTVLATFKIIQEPVKRVPEVLTAYIQVVVSLQRLQKFLNDDELPDDVITRGPKIKTCVRDDGLVEEYALIKAIDCSFAWNPQSISGKPTLSDINLTFKVGEKIAICGAVGSGKSSLICALLGEIPKLGGDVQLVGSTAYVPQSPWIQSGTIRDNILFGKSFDEAAYRETIKACSLDKDINDFAFGDLTEIGERGLNLSGGQKQRIQLARAIYSNSDIYLLDDPFSAVDAHTGAALFNDCVMGILAKKTVVLVTHQVEFLKAFDCILVMQDGEIQQSGCYHDLLMRAGETFEQLVNAHQGTLATVSFGEIIPTDHEMYSQFKQIQKKRPLGESIQLVQDEITEEGDMGLKPYMDYIRVSKGWLIFGFMIIWQVVFTILLALSNFWLGAEISDTRLSQALVVGGYALLSVASGLFVQLRSTYNTWLGLKASKAFFYGMIRTVFKARMSFFDSTPTGRILSRVSTDLAMIDLDMPFCFGFALFGFFDKLVCLIAIAVVIWEILIFAIPMMYISLKLQHYYVRSAQELMRLNATTKAPIVNFCGEAAQGATTIRAFQMVEKFKRKNLCLIDNDSTLYFHNNAALEWFVQRLEFLSYLVLCAVALLLVIFPTSSSGYAGLALIYAISFSISEVFFAQWQCKLVNYIVSVERITQYMHLPDEGPLIIEGSRPPSNWPEQGKVVLENLKVRYTPNGPLVIHGITCTFEGGRKIGVVGRTGSGKTTLISALFRLVEPEDGRILIDGVDICSIGLHDLRSRLGIIPQEPTLFQGTVRYNLDPLEQYTDEAIWQALDRCQLGKAIRESPSQLDAHVRDGGENWSAGQRQLFCLGRVLLKQSKILVLDEATASVDSQTDAVLQKVIREEFIDCTVITVAHRIPTVIDSDMVLALRDGKLAEYDTPTKLLDDGSSLFARLVSEYWSHTNKMTKPSSL